MTEIYTRYRHQCIIQCFNCVIHPGLECQEFFDRTNTNVFKEWEVNSLLLNVLKVAVTLAGVFNVQS